MTPCTVNGWRPHSVTSQPASSATNPAGPAIATARRNGRGHPLRRSARTAARERQRGEERAEPDHHLEGEVDVPVVGGQTSRGNASSPFTSASGSWKARSERPRGISRA